MRGCGRPPLSHPAALETPSRVSVLLEHRLGDVRSPRSALCARPRRRRRDLLRDMWDYLWLAAARRRRLGPPRPRDRH
eukprot:10841238-Alexandrium_andersonii.AAC.1